MLTDRELATVLAALRHWQATVIADGLESASRFPHFEPDTTPLSVNEIDALCDYLNEAQQPCECEAPGSFTSGVPGIIARMENGKLAAGASVERCDHCRRYTNDEAAHDKLVELGLT